MAQIRRKADPPGTGRNRLRIVKTILLLAGLTLVAGCEKLVVSLYPFFAEDDWVREPNIIGTWISDDQIWHIKANGNKYKLRLVEGLHPAMYDLYLARINDKVLMDLEPNGPPPDLPMTLSMHLATVHSLWRIEIDTDHVRLATMNPQVAERLLNDDPNSPSFGKFNQQIVLTDNTSSIRSFITRQIDFNDLWQSGFILTKARPLPVKNLLVHDPNLPGRWKATDLLIQIDKPQGKLFSLIVLPGKGPCQTLWGYLMDLNGRQFLLLFMDKNGLETEGFAPSCIPDVSVLVQSNQTELRLGPVPLQRIYDMLENRQIEPPEAIITLQKLD